MGLRKENFINIASDDDIDDNNNNNNNRSNSNDKYNIVYIKGTLNIIYTAIIEKFHSTFVTFTLVRYD